MEKIFFTIAGVDYFHGSDFMEPEMRVHLVKDPDNDYDNEAIKVEMEGIGQVGHVANSVHTVLGESYSAGRLYDKIGETAEGIVQYVLPRGVVCYIDPESCIG